MAEGSAASRYVKLRKEQAPVEDITPGELNQPIDVPQLNVRKCHECMQVLPETYEPPSDENWTTGIFACAEDPESCRTGLFCPCVLFGRNVEAVREEIPWTQPCVCHAVCVEGGMALAAVTALFSGYIDPQTTVVICEGLFFAWWMCGIYSGLFRQELQKKYHLKHYILSITIVMALLNSVADLKPFKTMWRVRVSIVRLWKQYSAAGGLTIEMVLIDSNGDKIHATVKKELVNQFDHLLEQGKTLTCTNFSVSHSLGSYRTTNHLYKLSFLATTRLRSCAELPGGLNGFTHVSFQEVLDGSLNPDFLIDVIGHVVEVSHVEMISVNGKETQKISLELRDTGDVCLPMVLWGKFASDVTNAIQLLGEGRLILVLRFGKIKVWKEDRSVANAYNVSEVHLNPNMAEVEAFRDMLPNDDLGLAIVESKPRAVAAGVSEKDDFFIHTPRKTIAEMIDCRQVEKCIVMCTIATIESDMGWYYLSCKVCSKKVQYEPPLVSGDRDDDDLSKFKIYCSKCKCYDPKLLPRS